MIVPVGQQGAGAAELSRHGFSCVSRLHVRQLQSKRTRASSELCGRVSFSYCGYRPCSRMGRYGTQSAARPPPVRRFSYRALPASAAIGIRLRGMTHHDASDQRSGPSIPAFTGRAVTRANSGGFRRLQTIDCVRLGLSCVCVSARKRDPSSNGTQAIEIAPRDASLVEVPIGAERDPTSTRVFTVSSKF